MSVRGECGDVTGAIEGGPTTGGGRKAILPRQHALEKVVVIEIERVDDERVAQESQHCVTATEILVGCG
jgi:phospholipid N-methyltransferase